MVVRDAFDFGLSYAKTLNIWAQNFNEKAEELAKTTDNTDSMAEGISLSLKLFVSTLEKSGIALVDPLGEPFDPQLHEAMAMVPNPEAEPNSVMDVMQRGYTLNGRLVRAAKVVVVKSEQ